MALLLNAGADASGQEHADSTPLNMAISMESLEMVTLLLAAGANPHCKCGTMLILVILTGSTKIIELLLNAGANVTMQAGTVGTALGAVVILAREDLLLDAGADATPRNPRGQSVLTSASMLGDIRIMGLLTAKQGLSIGRDLDLKPYPLITSVEIPLLVIIISISCVDFLII